MYSSNGKIRAHYDSFNWFSNVFLMKLLNNSGLHLSCNSKNTIPCNKWLFHPLPIGSSIELNEFTFTWYKHSKLRWMSANGRPSMTMMLRYINENALIHQYPFI